jgi:AcrR family transcriptional regulator
MNTSSLSKSEQTQMRLLDAVEQLADSGPMTGITMRAVADQADCSLGLAYRYFPTKDALLGAVLDRAAAFITDGLNPNEPLTVLAERTWQRMGERPVFARLFTWLVLERRDITEVMTGHPFLQVAAQRATQIDDPDPATAAAALGIVVLGGGYFAPALNQAAGLPANDQAIYQRLMSAIAALENHNGTHI